MVVSFAVFKAMASYVWIAMGGNRRRRGRTTHIRHLEVIGEHHDGWILAGMFRRGSKD
jgi:hypothetical protein